MVCDSDLLFWGHPVYPLSDNSCPEIPAL